MKCNRPSSSQHDPIFRNRRIRTLTAASVALVMSWTCLTSVHADTLFVANGGYAGDGNGTILEIHPGGSQTTFATA
jgi:hypothetical protein